MSPVTVSRLQDENSICIFISWHESKLHLISVELESHIGKSMNSLGRGVVGGGWLKKIGPEDQQGKHHIQK